jgi:hypothetical protein
MPIDFPSSPSVGQQYSYGGLNYVFTAQGNWVSPSVAPPVQSTLIPSGSLMLFQQSASPTGWTKQTSHNDKSLRVVSGAAASGGVQAFSTVFGRTGTDGFTLTPTTMPSHAHGMYDPAHSHQYMYTYGPDHYDAGGAEFAVWGYNSSSWQQTYGSGTGVATYGAGSDGGHGHGLDIRVLYVDVIIASKD